eukprot:INCI15029.1.p1 GENE.INCI15029.1~~INCI15029.1.p1  ORF type:complete len:742 (+),score=114.70 INCI15029.1:140-2365(+)
MNASKIFVGNLDFGVEESELRELFAPFGCVQGINIRKDRRTGRPRGFAFVTFDEPASAAAAIEAMHLKEHRGRPLTVKSQLARGTAPAPLSAPSLFHSTSAAGEHSLRSAEQPPSGDRSSPTSRHETGSLQKAKKKSKTKKNLLFFAAGSGSSSDDSDSSSAGSEDEEDGHDVLSTQTSAAPSRALSQNDALVAKASAREVLRNHFERGYSVLRSTNAAEANDSIEAIFQVEFHQEFLAPFPRHFLSIDPAQESCPDSRTAFFKADQVPESVSKFWSEKRVTVTSTDTATLVPAPFKSFETAILPKSFCALLKQQFKAPSPIQAQGWPMLLSGCNLIGVADTGSGKTLAFLLPAFVHLLLSPLHRAKCRGIFVPTPGASVGAKSASPLCGPIAVVMAPTRELASQIHSTAAKFVDERARWLLQHQADEVWMGKWQTHVARCPPGVSGIRVGLVCGGGQRNLQLRQCRAGLDLLVATPGRLLDFMQSGHTRLYTRTTLFILDEADRMLDLGFAPYIRSVLSHVRPDCQKALFSATWPPEVEALSVQMMREHGGMLPQDDNNSQPLAVPMLQKLQIGSTQLSTSHSVEQLFCFPGDDLQKTQLLRKYISQTPGGAERVLVFVSRKDTCKELKSELCEMFERRADAGEIACIHGDLNQVDRTAALQRFKSGTVKVLVATDVASRGLDVSGLERVINYDFPYTIEDYVHRIGRTGRAGKTGQSVSFFTGHDASMCRLCDYQRGDY